MNAYPLLGYKTDFHNLSHFFSDDKPISDGLAWHMKHFGYLVGKLRDTKEGNASLVDHAAVLFLFESGAKSAHSTDKMACLLAGRAGGLQPGRHVVATGAHPGQVVLSAMNAVGVPGNTFGEVSGALPALFGN
jgi:hypothetical protein